MGAVNRVRDDFGMDYVVFVAARGMLTGRRLSEIRSLEGVDWLTASGSNGCLNMDTTPNPFQRKVFHLLSTITLPRA